METLEVFSNYIRTVPPPCFQDAATRLHESDIPVVTSESLASVALLLGEYEREFLLAHFSKSELWGIFYYLNLFRTKPPDGDLAAQTMRILMESSAASTLGALNIDALVEPGALGQCGVELAKTPDEPEAYVRHLIAANELSRRAGLLWLEDFLPAGPNLDLLRQAMQWVIDGTEAFQWQRAFWTVPSGLAQNLKLIILEGCIGIQGGESSQLIYAKLHCTRRVHGEV